MPSLGNLFVTIGAKTQGLDDGAKKSESTLNSLQKSMRSVIGSSALLATAAVGAGAAIIASLVNSGRLAIDTQAKLAQALDGTIGGLRATEMAAGDAGVATEELYAIAAKLNSRLGEATGQTGAAYDALTKLGLSAESLIGLDIDQRFAAIADAMRSMNLSGAESQDIMRDLGVRNENLANLMRQGGDAFREQAQAVRDLGLNLSMVDAAKVEAANRAIDDMGDVVTVIQDKLTVAAAPYLEVLATKFKELTIGNSGFRDGIDSTIKGILSGFGKAADVIQGLRFVFKGVELAAKGFAATSLIVLERTFSAITFGADLAIMAINKISGTKIELLGSGAFMSTIRELRDSTIDSVSEAREELAEIANQEMPSVKVKKFMDEVAAHSLEAAKKVVAARQAILGEGGEKLKPVDTGNKKDQDQFKKDMEAWNAKNAAELETVKQRYLTEEQLLAEHRELMLVIGEEWDAAKFDTEEQWRSVKEQAEAEHLQRLTDMNRSAYEGIANLIALNWGKSAASTAGAIKSIVGTMATGSRKAFEISKAWALADALISTYQGIAAGVKLGWPMGIPAVAWAAATGFAQVSAIKNQSFGGAGGAAASGNGAPATAPNPVGVGGSSDQGGGGGTYRFEGLSAGSFVSSDMVIEMLKQAQKDGALRGQIEFAA